LARAVSAIAKAVTIVARLPGMKMLLPPNMYAKNAPTTVPSVAAVSEISTKTGGA